jgi:ATP-dependent DNA ligase
MDDSFEKKDILPMLLFDAPPFDDPEFIFELKFDGIRCIAYLGEGKTVLKSRRNKDISAAYPELGGIHRLAKNKCIIDGEIIAVEDGKPSFSRLQKRQGATDKLKVELLSRTHPVQLVAFDILLLGGKRTTGLKILERKKLLDDNVAENEFLSISRFISGRGKDFFELAKREGLEGVVAKRKDSVYAEGVRSRDWLKIKALFEEDLIVVGYTAAGGLIKDLILGYFDLNKRPVLSGRIYAGGGIATQKLLAALLNDNQAAAGAAIGLPHKVIAIAAQNAPQAGAPPPIIRVSPTAPPLPHMNISRIMSPPPIIPVAAPHTAVPVPPPVFAALPFDISDVIWLKPNLVATISYLQKTANGYRHPVFKGIRADKVAAEIIRVAAIPR